jgi:hypothetical protein
MRAEEIQQSLGLRAAGTEVDIGDKQSAKASFRTLFTHSVRPMHEQLTVSRDSVMTSHAADATARIDHSPLLVGGIAAVYDKQATGRSITLAPRPAAGGFAYDTHRNNPDVPYCRRAPLQ